MDIERKQTSVLILILFLNTISLYIEALVPSFHKPLKTSSIKIFGLLLEPGGDFPGPVTVGIGIYGLSLRLECSEQYAFVIPEDCEHHFPGGWCHLKHFFWQATQDVSTALTHALSRAANGEPKTHHL
jgi:hypothetical protein